MRLSVHPLRTATAARRLVLVGCAVSLALQIGCYSYRPIQSAPPESGEVGVLINDKGRLALNERMGALIDRIDGQIVERKDGMVVLRVNRVVDVRGNISTWTGEQVAIPEDGVMGFRPRKLSKFKTALLVVLVAAGVVLTLGTSLDVFGDPKTDGPGDGPQQS